MMIHLARRARRSSCAVVSERTLVNSVIGTHLRHTVGHTHTERLSVCDALGAVFTASELRGTYIGSWPQCCRLLRCGSMQEKKDVRVNSDLARSGTNRC